MKYLMTLLLFAPLVEANPTTKDRVASITCAIISETTLNQSAYRVKEVNEARSKLNLDPYLEGDQEILFSIRNDLCNLLILDFEKYKGSKIQREKQIEEALEKERIEKKRQREELKRESQRKKEEMERKLQRELERQEEKDREERLQKMLSDYSQLEKAFDNCDLPNDSTKISIEKNLTNLSLGIFLDFTESVRKSCPSLISGSRKLKLNGRREVARGESFSPLTQRVKEKLSNLSITKFYYEVKVDGFLKDLILNGSQNNCEQIFNIERVEQENTLFSGTKSVVKSIGIDGYNVNGKDPYNRPSNWKKQPHESASDCGFLDQQFSESWDAPFFTNKKELKKIKVGMIREISFVSIPEERCIYFECLQIKKPPIKKIIYSRK